MIYMNIWVIGCVCLIVNSTHPGLLFNVPFPITIPPVALPLPLSIDSFIIDGLQLTQIQIQSVNYSWNFKATYGEVTVSTFTASFNWRYNQKDSGVGQFIDSNLIIKSSYTFQKSSVNRFTISITNSTLQIGKTHVTLHGQGLTPILIEKITQIIINRASIFFRKQLQQLINKQLIALAASLGEDIKLYCWSSQSCMYISTLLVSDPAVNSSQMTVSANGYVYITGENNTHYLDPSSSIPIVKNPSISLQLHPQIFSSIVDAYLRLFTTTFVINLNQLSSLITINTHSLSSLFPKIQQYQPQTTILLKTEVVNFTVQNCTVGYINVTFTINTILQEIQQEYLQTSTGCIKVQIEPVYGNLSSNIRLKILDLQSVQFNNDDVAQGKVVPDMLTKYEQVIGSWIKSILNGKLNKQVIQWQYAGIKTHIQGTNKDAFYQLDINFFQ